MASINVNLKPTTQMVKKYGNKYSDLNIGFTVPPSAADFSQNLDIEAIQKAVHNIFSWKRGERIILPDFGNPLFDYIYEEMTPTVMSKIRSEMRTLLAKWEPRVSISVLDIVQSPDQNEITVYLEYIIPTLSNTNVYTYNANLRK